ncbi:MAG: hypothetical protein R2867_44675 [Caldilineaceae bacterium]
MTDAGEPLATIEVVETGAVQSGCEVVAGQRTLPLHARLALERPATTSTRKRVTLAIPAGMVLNAVRDRLAQDDLAAVVALVSAESGADLQLALVDDALDIQDGTGHWLGKRYALRDLNRMRRPLRAVDLDPVANDLQRIVRAQHLDLLVSADSDLADALELTLRELVYDGAGEDVLAGATVANVGGAAGANRHPQSMPIVQHNRPYVLEIHNRSEESIYVALLLRSGAWRVEQLYPEIQGAREALSPGRTLVLGLSANPQRQIRLSIRNIGPSEELTFLLIGTVAEADFESLLQQETGGNEAAEATQRVTRSFRMGGTATAADEWMSLQLKALVVRA